MSDEGALLRPEGALDFGTVGAVLAKSSGFADPPELPQHLVADLSAVTGVDSSAVALLIEWRRIAHEHGRTLEFANVPPNLMALAHLYGVAEMIQPSPAAA